VSLMPAARHAGAGADHISIQQVEYVNSTWPHCGGLSWPHRRGCG
jgi:hypothetical protein